LGCSARGRKKKERGGCGHEKKNPFLRHNEGNLVGVTARKKEDKEGQWKSSYTARKTAGTGTKKSHSCHWTKKEEKGPRGKNACLGAYLGIGN